jgi:hypothetical protein
LSEKGSNGTKELKETPRMMKAFDIQAVSSFPTIDILKAKAVGFVISGMFVIFHLFNYSYRLTYFCIKLGMWIVGLLKMRLCCFVGY